jgi:hypothetical protein
MLEEGKRKSKKNKMIKKKKNVATIEKKENKNERKK